MKFGLPSLAATSLLLAQHAMADQVFNDDVIVDGRLCAGFDCVNGEAFGGEELKLKDVVPRLFFDDTSPSSHDWELAVDDSVSGVARGFSIRDVSAGTYPFVIAPGAGAHRIFIDDSGDIGIGTSLPQVDLHIVNPDGSARLRLEETASPSKVYELGADSTTGFRVSDISLFSTPFILRPGAPTFSIDVKSNGDVGLGTSAPEGKLHTRGPGTQLAYFESSDGGAVQVRFRTNSENRRFLAVNNANQVQSQIVFGNNQIQFLGQTVAQEWLRISSAGIVSSGPTCNPNPCDATFDPEVFTVPPIEERAAYMWENMYLPAVGPTAPNQPFNVTEKLGGVIHELEIAHIYIGQLNTQVTTQAGLLTQYEAERTTLLSRLEVQEERLKSLEVALDAIGTRE